MSGCKFSAITGLQILLVSQAQEGCQEAAVQFDKACNIHRGAKETISAAEKKIQGRPGAFDATWQEMLNHADIKVMNKLSFQ